VESLYGPSLDGTRLAPDRYFALWAQDFDAFGSAAATDLSIEVPSCPGWTMRDLVSHLVGVYRHKSATLESGKAPGDRESGGWGDLDPDRDPIDELRQAYDDMRGRLSGLSPDAPAATFWPPEQTAGFWMRRMAQETAVHRWDADAAAHGEAKAQPIDEDLALDGVDELLGWLAWEWDDRDALAGAHGQTVVVSSGTHAWTVRLHPTAIVVEGGVTTDDPDAWITGDASDVLLDLWGRTASGVTIAGDADVVSMMRARLDASTS
jgi:uncharacterized protein (TIGR03083 family)